MAAIIARPEMIDVAFGVEPGFLGDEQNSVAAWASRPVKIFERNNACRWNFCRWDFERGLEEHRRSSSTLTHRTPNGCTLQGLHGKAATRR
jgi:hypothetical protein